MNSYHLLAKSAYAQPSPWQVPPRPPTAPSFLSQAGGVLDDNKYAAIGTVAGSIIPGLGTVAGGLAGTGLDMMASRSKPYTHSALGKTINLFNPVGNILGKYSPGALYDRAMGNAAPAAPAAVSGPTSFGTQMLQQGMAENRNR